MTLSEHEKLLLKYAGTKEADFLKMSEDDQDKALSDGFKKYKAARKLKGKEEQFKAAQTAVPKVKDFFMKSTPKVLVKKLGTGSSITEALIVGYCERNNKYLAISPTIDKSTIKVSQLEESDIIMNPEDM